MAIDKITASGLGDGGVSTADIADGAITDGKIAAVAATKLTGTIADARFPATLPAISGANLTGVADATKVPLAGGTMTGNLVVNTASPNVDMIDTGTSHASTDYITNSNAVRVTIGAERAAGGGLFVGSSAYAAVFGTASSGATEFATNNTVRMSITSDGRGLSQFTAKAWVNFNGEASPLSVNDSHNVSSVTDDAIGRYTVNFQNALGNTHYAVAAQTEDGGGYNDPRIINHESGQARSTTAYGLYHWHIGSSALDDATKLNVIVFGD